MRKCVAVVVVVVRVESGDKETAPSSLLVPPFGLLGEYVSSQILGETYAEDLLIQLIKRNRLKRPENCWIVKC